MGQFTEMSIQIESQSEESAEKIADQIQNLNEYLTPKMGGKEFHTSINSIDTDGNTVYVELSSGRFTNAEWQTNQILEMLKDLFKGEFTTFTADYTVPETLIYQEFDDKGEQI